jgi:hypothetical protein
MNLEELFAAWQAGEMIEIDNQGEWRLAAIERFCFKENTPVVFARVQKTQALVQVVSLPVLESVLRKKGLQK